MALLQRFSFILLFATLIGCGGSSGGFDETTGEGDGSTPDAITISLAISDRNLSQSTPQTLTVSVMQGNTPVYDKLVTFSISNEDLASFSTDVNTSSTDVNGQAEIGLLVGESSGDGSITATVDGVDSNSITFSSAGDGAIQDDTTLILEISARNLSQSTPQALTATMMQGGSPVSDQLITFTISNDELASFDAEFNTRSTNEMGKAEIGLLAGTSAGDGSVIATVNGVSSNAITFSSAGDGGVTLILTISGENVSQATPQTLTAILMQGTTPISTKLVTFSISNADLASFSTDVNTSSTNLDGEAEIGLIVGASSGDGSITASAEGVSSNSVTFKSAGDSDVVGEPVASAVSLFASSQQIASSGDDEITLISIAKDENNNLVEGVTVSFSATSGQIEVIDSITGTNGQATAILRTNNEPTNRLITVTSSSGQVIDSVDVQVIGTTINLTGSSSLAINDENSFFIEVLNSNSEAIPNARVELSLNPPISGDTAVITVADSVITDITGQASFTVTGTTGGTNTLVVSALGVVTEHEITVQADSFLFSSFNNGQGPVTPDDNKLSDVLLSDTATIELTWQRSNVAVADGTNVNFTSTRGIVSPSSTTTINGKASTTITSNNAGKALVTVTGTDDGVTLSNQLEFEFVAGTVAIIDAQASPNSIAANGETSTISVVVKDADGNLVKGKTIDSPRVILVYNNTQKPRNETPITKCTNIKSVQTCGFGPKRPFNSDSFSPFSKTSKCNLLLGQVINLTPVHDFEGYKLKKSAFFELNNKNYIAVKSGDNIDIININLFGSIGDEYYFSTESDIENKQGLISSVSILQGYLLHLGTE